MSQNLWDNGKLAVSENGRYLQHANGRPFFWLGDTCWLLVQKLNRDEDQNLLRRPQGQSGQARVSRIQG